MVALLTCSKVNHSEHRAQGTEHSTLSLALTYGSCHVWHTRGNGLDLAQEDIPVGHEAISVAWEQSNEPTVGMSHDSGVQLPPTRH